MSTTPLFSFLDRPEAERAQKALWAAGIECLLRAPGDELPLGWRRDPTDSSFTLWLARERYEEAMRIIQDSGRDSETGPTCQRCGAGNPTIHLTVLHQGTSVTTHFCEKCHSDPS